MVFLFPGILFRKFYFNGEFTNQFNQGNLLERFLWTLFFSIISLVFCGTLIYIVTIKLGYEFIHNIDFCTINGIFKSLATNTYPYAFTLEEKVFEIGIVLSIIWFLSAIFGFLAYKSVKLLGFDYMFSALRFNNEWHYLAMASKENGINRKWGDRFVTFLDILVQKKEKEELYRGSFKKNFFDRDNKIEQIVIENPSKFITLNIEAENILKIDSLKELSNSPTSPFSLHQEYTDKIIFKKDIDGKMLVLPYQHIQNINITYLKISNTFAELKLVFLRILLFLFYIVLLGLVILPFIKMDIKYFDTFFEKLFFSVVSLFTTAIALDFFKSFFQGWEIIKKKIAENIALFLTFCIPYLYVFEVFNGWITFLFFVIALIGSGMFMNSKKE